MILRGLLVYHILIRQHEEPGLLLLTSPLAKASTWRALCLNVRALFEPPNIIQFTPTHIPHVFWGLSSHAYINFLRSPPATSTL